MSRQIGASRRDAVDSPPVQPVVGRELAVPLGAHQEDLGVDEAVAALDQAVTEEVSDVGGPHTPARRPMRRVGELGCGSYRRRSAHWFHPRVMRRQVDIGADAGAVVGGSALLGIVGAALAVPVAVAIQLIVREVVVPDQERT